MKKDRKHMNDRGKTGCGCLVAILVIIMVIAGIGFHPVSLKSVTKYLRYEDAIVTADAIFVPRFHEDKNGELYSDAFREYFAGNGRVIYVENDRLVGRKDIGATLSQMAQARGVKENVIKTVNPGNRDAMRPSEIKKKLRAAGLKKVIVIVPEYAARRYHQTYSRETGGTLYMIKPLKVSYFQGDRWWRDHLSRALTAHEVYIVLLHYYNELLKKDSGE
jgi:hypothetical protein